MPYVSWERLGIEEDCIKQWAKDLNQNSARNYVYYLNKFLKWAKNTGYWYTAEEMINDAKSISLDERYQHLEVVLNYIKNLGTGYQDRKTNFSAIKNFYDFHKAPLPKPSKAEVSRCLKPSEKDKARAIDTKPLEVEEVKRIVQNMVMPYKAALLCIFQSGMGRSEFDLFNQRAWKNIVDKLDDEEPVRVDLYREKTSLRGVSHYYTFLGKDSKQVIKEWLETRDKIEHNQDTLFIVHNKNQDRWVPLTGRTLSEKVTQTAKKIGLVKPNGLNRYHINLHEHRDLFKSLCTLAGVAIVASEYFLGHQLDKLGYEKSPKYDPEFFRNEYKKVEPQLNIISNPEGKTESEEEQYRKWLRLMGAPEEKQEEIINILLGRTKVDGDPEEVAQDMIREQFQEMVGLAPNTNNKEFKQIEQSELINYLNAGWEIYQQLNNGSNQVIISRPKQ